MLDGSIRNPDLTCVGPGQKGRVGQKPGCCQALPDALWVGVFFPKWVEVLANLRQTSIESAHWRRMCEVLFFAFYGGLPQAPNISSYRRSQSAQVQGNAEAGKTYIPPYLKTTLLKSGGGES